MDNSALREELANYAHEAWSGWMNYMLGKADYLEDGRVVLPAYWVERWERQLGTPYPLLPENEQKSDLDEADKMLKIVDAHRG